MTQSVAFSPAKLLASRPTEAVFVLRNDSPIRVTLKMLLLAVRGPNCADWCEVGADFPAMRDVTIEPGAQIEYRQRQAIEQAGPYRAVVAYQDSDGVWRDDVVNSARFSFTVNPGIELAVPLAMSPEQPVAGEVFTTTFTLRNASDEALTLRRVFAAGRGPNCADWGCNRSADTPHEENITLAPGQRFEYRRSRIYVEPGDYFVQPMFMFSDSDWHLLGSKTNFTQGAGIALVGAVQMSPTNPAAGQTVQLSYTVKNLSNKVVTVPRLGAVARGPNCAGKNWECAGYADFPQQMNVTLAPGTTYNVVLQRAFAEGGDGYWLEPAYADYNPWWMMMAGASRLTFQVSAGLVLVQAPMLIPANPVAGEVVRATFTVRNDSAQPITLTHLALGAQGPNCSNLDCAGREPGKWSDFPERKNLAIQPGETFEFSGQRMFLNEGSDYVMQAVYRLGESWFALGALQRFNVGHGLTFAENTRIEPSQPAVGQRYTVTFALVNQSDRTLSIPALAVGGRDANCDTPECNNNAGLVAHENVTIAPGASVRYVESRSLDKDGTYFVEPAIRMNDVGWWMPISATQRLTFTVGLSEVTNLPVCAMTINDGSLFTNRRDVTVRLNVPDATRLEVSNDGGFVNASQKPYASNFAWQLPDVGNRVATVMVRVRAYADSTVLCGGELSDDVVFDPVAPTVSLAWQGNGSTRASQQTNRMLQVLASDFADGSGVADMQISTQADFGDARWQPYQASVSLLLPDTDLYVRVRDRAGNLSRVIPVPMFSPGYHFVYLPLMQN